MRNLFYEYNVYGCLIFHYSDDNGERIKENYLFYPLKEAIQRFREKHNLQRKHIRIEALYKN